jgi:thiamine kinase-like enzyme
VPDGKLIHADIKGVRMHSLQMGIVPDLSSEVQLSEAEVVRIALRPGLMKTSLEEALERMGVWQSRGAPGAKSAPVCGVLDMKYEPGDYCTLLYQLDEQIVAGHIQWKEEAETPEMAGLIPALGMQVYPFPMDPWLPGLGRAMDTQVVTRALVQALPELSSGEARILRLQITLQRYRPGKRLTLRLDLSLRDARTGELSTRRLYGKVYHKPEKAKSVYEEMQQLSNSAAARQGAIVLARAAAHLPDLSMVLQEPVGGVPLEDLFGRLEGAATTGDGRARSSMPRAAAALAALHTSGISSDRWRTIEDELARFRKRSARVEKLDAGLGRRMGELAAALPAWLDHLPEWGAEISLIHGDCKPSQFLIGSEHVALLDFDHCGMADPANDVGTFLATLRQMAVRQALKSRQPAPAAARGAWLLSLEKEFLAEYCLARASRRASPHAEVFRLRATWYEAVGLLRKALRGFGRSPFSPLPGALVAEAWRCLSDLPSPGKSIGRPDGS